MNGIRTIRFLGKFHSKFSLVNSGNNFLGLHTTTRCSKFFERDEKGGYRKQKENPLEIAKDEFFNVRSGLKMLKDELKLFKEEVKEKLYDDIQLVPPGAIDIVWKFDDPKKLDKWVVTSDSDHGEGFSNCSLTLNKNKKALFHGFLRTEVPKDGRIKTSGYCNMRSMRPRRSFKRDSSYNWCEFTHLLMRVRGDGRSYMIVIGSAGDFDVHWNDVYSFPLYTRGGPYWQMAKIPFSRFFLSAKGRVQDKQRPLPLENITSFGISCGDKIPGPFNLEIDYIGLQYDPNHTEEFAYEMYSTPKFVAGY